MFTGIISHVGRVERAALADDRLRFSVSVPWKDVTVGESIAIDGTCLTVAATGRGSVAFDAVGETLRKTTLGRAREGTRVNLERAVRVGEFLGGHFVSGHVDGLGSVAGIERRAGDVLYRFSAPAALLREIVPKGSIAVDGISLTVVATPRGGFTCTLIPFTLENTTLGSKTSGDPVNLETDILAKYARKALGR